MVQGAEINPNPLIPDSGHYLFDLSGINTSIRPVFRKPASMGAAL
jgi:hypothetical protein